MTQPKKISDLVLNQGEQEAFDAFAEIELTEKEKNAALLDGRKKKYFENKISEYKKRLMAEVEIKSFTPNELYQKVFDSGFVFDATNKQIIWNLCRYFAGDPKGPLDLRKGIMLYGPVGCYKTSLMRFFANNQSNSFAIFPVNDISNQFIKDGFDAIEKYKSLLHSHDKIKTFGQEKIGICFDDFGTEVDKKHYGNESNVMCDILLSRYNNHYMLFGKTHITTNINSDTIEERYGIRVRSRLREMVNLVEFPDDSPDRRK